MPNYSKIPALTMEALDRWVKHGLMPGSFLTAVLSNDLMGAMALADDDNRAALYETVAWLRDAAPNMCWGSPDKVKAWAVYRRAHGRALQVSS